MKHESNLTSKGQVTIPKDIRDALGLKPGSKVRFEMNAAGNAVIKAADTAQEYAQREAEIVNRVRQARALFKAENTLPEGMSADEWYDLMRGPHPEV
jgi:AbrB family looped-hinge helix DNA binding protein